MFFLCRRRSSGISRPAASASADLPVPVRQWTPFEDVDRLCAADDEIKLEQTAGLPVHHGIVLASIADTSISPTPV